MTDNEKLVMLKALIGTTRLSDDALSVYLKIAGEKVIGKCFGNRKNLHREVPEEYETIQVELACNEVLKRGAEGQSSFSDNGVSRVYESEDVLLRRIVPYVQVPGVVPDETD